LERKTAELILSRKLGGAEKKPPKLQHKTESVPNLLAADKALYSLLFSVSTTWDDLLSNRTQDGF
jgi:hypothetical protein